MEMVSKLKDQLHKEEIRNSYYEIVFEELSERLDFLEKNCHSKDKASLHKLQLWVKSKKN
jgi:hypothetical protein